jgi:hypothetical protein
VTDTWEQLRLDVSAPRSAVTERWLTKEQLAKRLDVSVRWIDYRRVEGLPCHKWGGVVRFRLSEVEAWLSERRIAA